MIRGKYMDSPIGRLYLAEEAGCIVRLSRGGTGIETAGDVPEALARAEAEVTEYLKGMRRQFTVPVKPSGTPFQERVWKAPGRRWKRGNRSTGGRPDGRSFFDGRFPIFGGQFPARAVSSYSEMTGFSVKERSN